MITQLLDHQLTFRFRGIPLTKGVFHSDWLTENGLNGKEDVEMPRHIVDSTRQRYKEAYHLLTGRVWEATSSLS